MSSSSSHRAAASPTYSRQPISAADETQTLNPHKTHQTHQTESTFTTRARHSSAASAKRELAFVGDSAAIRRLRLQVSRIGPHFRAVLIRGEAGTEKAQVARTLHALSHRAAADFIHCPAASLFCLHRPEPPKRPEPPERPEATGIPEKPGRLEGPGRLPRPATPGNSRAHTAPQLVRERSLETVAASASGGTLYLEDVDQLSPAAQATLLRILRRHEFAAGGGHLAQQLGCRIIASTSEELKTRVAAGSFAQELYQRLTAVEIFVPPLRERAEDLAELIQQTLDRLARTAAAARLTVSPQAFERMLAYAWPGNLHQLETVLASAAARCDTAVLDLHHLPLLSSGQTLMPPEQTEANVRLQDVVERHVMLVLKACGGNKLRAAERLGISRSTLYRMLDAGSMSELLQ